MTQTRAKIIPVLVIASLLLPLLLFAYTGTHSRYIADDYCTTYRALQDGVIGSTLWWYNNWAGQFTNWIIKGMIAQGGVAIIPILAAGVLIFWCITASWTTYQLALVIRLPQRRFLALALGLLLVFAVFDSTPSIIQSLYWIGALVPYTSPLIIMTLLIGFVTMTLRRNPHRVSPLSLAVIAILTFIAGGLSEVYVALQIAVLGLAFLGFLFFAPKPMKRPALILLGTGLFCSFLAMFIILVAPGNAIRQAHFPRLPLPEVIWRTIYVSLSYVATAIGMFAPVTIAVSLLLPLLLTNRLESLPPHLRLSPPKVRRLLALSAATALILVMACIAPPIYGTSVAPAARVYILPQFVLVITAVFWGCVIGLGARWRQPHLKPSTRLLTTIGIIALLVLGPLVSTWQTLKEVPDFQTYAKEWDAHDADIRAAAASGQRTVETQMLTVDIGIRAGLETIGMDSDKGVNTCAARYYGIDTLTARTLLQMDTKSGLLEQGAE